MKTFINGDRVSENLSRFAARSNRQGTIVALSESGPTQVRWDSGDVETPDMWRLTNLSR
jgi:hypothetical protein